MKDTVLAFQTKLKTPPDWADAPASQLTIDVIYTSRNATSVALRKAAWLAKHLSARITLLVFQVVPYPLPIESPPVLLDWNERRFRAISEENAVEASVQFYLCRDRETATEKVLPPDSFVVVGGRRRWWWPTGEERLVRKLRAAGHSVTYAEVEK